MPEYLKRQLIAYLGNKRALLPFLSELLGPLAVRNGARAPVFLDPFAGSGSVARLARSLGYEVHANDWETYAWVANRAYLSLTPAGAEALFVRDGGLAAVLAELNSLKVPREEFIARHYAPRDTRRPDLARERLFYTRENALFLDAVREAIEDRWPEGSQAKILLLALLAYEASVHSNTSGVFKAFHKGFGGHSGDALGRILAPMELEYPALWDSPEHAEVGCIDALEFVRGRSAEVCYLDPPYNQHQYGSNYHLLNTVVRGDRPEATRKSGIRADWLATRSLFCSKATAPGALEALLDAIDARTLVVSYNTEGVIPFEVLHQLLESRGRVTIRVHDYVTYRGGRQSPKRQNNNLEFVLVVDTATSPVSGDRARVDRFLAERRLGTLLKGRFHPGRLRQGFGGTGTTLTWGAQSLETRWLYQIGAVDTTGLSAGELAQGTQALAAAQFISPAEEADTLYVLLSKELSSADRTGLEHRLLLVLRKTAFAKYEPEMHRSLASLREHLAQHPSARLEQGLAKLEELLARRYPRPRSRLPGGS